MVGLMITLIDNNKVFKPTDKIIISNYILIKFKGEKSVGIEKDDLIQWLKEMENPNEVD